MLSFLGQSREYGSGPGSGHIKFSREWRWRLIQMFVERVENSLTHYGWCPYQTFIGYTTKGININSMINLGAQALFRTHIKGAAETFTGLG